MQREEGLVKGDGARCLRLSRSLREHMDSLCTLQLAMASLDDYHSHPHDVDADNTVTAVTSPSQSPYPAVTKPCRRLRPAPRGSFSPQSTDRRRRAP